MYLSQQVIRTFGILLISNLICLKIAAQTESNWHQNPDIVLSGFADVFYVYDFNRPMDDFRQPFLFNHNRHNEFNLNLGYVKLSLDHSRYRANLALQTGTYANDNYAAEPGVLKNIFEANVGISLNKTNSLWLDAGILPSHIGFESAVSIENPTLTRSILAENSPYFLTGAKLTLNPDQKWEFAVLILNGWQLIQRVSGNSLPSFGTQVHFTPKSGLTLNWSTFIGTADPDITRRMRYFNNLYGQFQITERIGLIAGFDIGAQQTLNSEAYETWLSPVMIVSLQINPNWKTALRAEYYEDETGIITQTIVGSGLKTSGFSWNLDFSPTSNLAWRIEGRLLGSSERIFENRNGLTNQNFILATSIAIKISE